MNVQTQAYAALIEGGKHWSLVIRRGMAMRLTDIEGGANVGMLLYNPNAPLERYNAPDTLKCQHTFKLARGHCLYSDMGRIFCAITHDSLGWHDTIGGASDAAHVAARWGETSYQTHRNDRFQNGRDAFLVEAVKHGLGRRDLAANVNWFSKVAAGQDGALAFAPGHSPPGACVALRFEMDALVLLHTCAHPMDPAPDYPRRPVRVEIGAADPIGEDELAHMQAENRRGHANTAAYHLAAHGAPC